MSTKVQIQIDHVAEKNGEFVRVLAGELLDAGGNVVESGDAAEVANRREKWRGFCQLNATKTETIREYAQRVYPGTIEAIDWDSPIGEADVNWGICQ